MPLPNVLVCSLEHSKALGVRSLQGGDKRVECSRCTFELRLPLKEREVSSEVAAEALLKRFHSATVSLTVSVLTLCYLEELIVYSVCDRDLPL